MYYELVPYTFLKLNHSSRALQELVDQHLIVPILEHDAM